MSVRYAPFVVALAVALLPAAQAEISAERARALIHLVRQDCGSCHGMKLTGGLGTPLTPAALVGKPDAFLAGVILDGRSNTAMPPWRGLLTEDEAAWIAQRLKEGLPE